MTAIDVAKIFEEITPLESGIDGDQLGFVYGDPETIVTGIGCMSDANTISIGVCLDKNINMIICHELLLLPDKQSKWYDCPASDNLEIKNLRCQMLEEKNMVVYRSHSNWDALEEYGIYDQAVAALGIEGLKEVNRQRFLGVSQLPKPMTVAELKKQTEKGLGYNNCHIYGNSQKVIEKFSFLIGGFASNQFYMPQQAKELGAEAIIVGEKIEHIIVEALDMGLPVIETLHSVSEIPGIKCQAKLLQEKISEVPTKYIASGALVF